MAATGMPDGRYRLGALEVEGEDGRCMSNGSLAGSVLTMDRAVRNVNGICRNGRWPALCAWPHGTQRRRPESAGTPVRWHLALPPTIVVLSPTGEVLQTILGGQIA